jgi:glycosyltransferase involved in cell wall biosynthesis
MAEGDPQRHPTEVTMLLENDLYPHDVRVRYEAESLVRAGYRVRVIAPRGSGQPKRETVDGVAVERFRLPMDHAGRRGDLLWEYAIAHLQLYLRGSRSLLRGSRVLHVHNPPDTLFVPAVLGRPAGCRLVFDQHDLFAELMDEKFGPGPLLAAARVAQRASLKMADLVVATNQSQREAAIHTGAAPDRVIVVRNALRRSQLADRVSVRPGALSDPRLVFVGALEPQDGVRRIPELLRTLIDSHGLEGTSMTIAGYGSELESLKGRLAELGVADRVALTGRIGHQYVLDVIAGADICIDTAECNELNHRTTMVKVAEYLSLARPTVAFALRETERTTAGAAELAPCGDLQRFAELVAELARAPERRRDLGERARVRAEELVWEQAEAALLQGYARMLSA